MPHRPPALTRRPAPDPLPRPAHLLALGQALLLAALPHGGQRLARRNAWAGMSEQAVRSRAQREADAALRAAGTASSGSRARVL